ncbi:MAG: hypothetical protein WBE37_03725 [Bryobacteraceae bacterium]
MACAWNGEQPAKTTNGDLFGDVNSCVVKFNKAGKYITHWGREATGAGDFGLVHHAARDAQRSVADRSNYRVQIFDQDGKFLGKWTDAGSRFGLY